jgi:hypothetical protein
MAFVICGALVPEVSEIVRRRGWDVDLFPLSPDLHLRPRKIVEEVEAKIRDLQGGYDRILVVYGDCGTGGLLDRMLARYGVERVRGAHCYEMYAGALFHRLMEEEPGTYFLTDFMVRTFPRLERQMGLDAHPGLLSTYFRNYRRVVYLAQSGDGALREGAERIASKLGLPLETYIVGTNNLERLLEAVMSGAEPRGKGNPGGPGRPPG